MVFNDVSGGQGIVQDTYFEASANSTSYPIADLTRNANTALDNVVSIRLKANPKWAFDSNNAVDLPIGETDLVSGQQDYEFDDDFLVIKSIEIQDNNGEWHKIQAIDTYSIDEQESISKLSEESGTPQAYNKVGNSFLLIPKPNYNRRFSVEGEYGIRVHFERKFDYFTVSDTIKEPGFAKQLHKYIPLYCAYTYACAKELSKQASLAKRLEFYEGNELRGGNDQGAISKFYSYRELDVKRQMKPIRQDNK